MIEKLRQLKATGRFSEVNTLIPYTQFVGLEVIEIGGEVFSVMRQRDSNIGNPRIPAIHGGVVGAALEHAAIVELLYAADLNEMPRIINITIDFLRPVLNEDLWLKASIVRRGRRIANLRCEGWQASRTKLVAASHANFKLASVPEDPPPGPPKNSSQ